MNELCFYMKSGNIINVKNVIDWKIKHSGGKITSLEIERKVISSDKGTGLIVGSIDLSQIEAIVEK